LIPSIKTLSDACFELLIDLWELRKGDHIRSLSVKLEDFMADLFNGTTNLPRLILEHANVSEIESQANCSPNLAMYLGIAARDLNPASNGSPGNIKLEPVSDTLGPPGSATLGLVQARGSIRFWEPSLVDSALKRLVAHPEHGACPHLS
jgi:hypothetical protein